jgi:hypothetical protein
LPSEGGRSTVIGCGTTPPYRKTANGWTITTFEKGNYVGVVRKFLVALLSVVALTQTGCTSSTIAISSGNFDVISASLGCRGVEHHADGSTSIPMHVSRAGAQAVETVNVCFGQRGPYAFIVDTGAATTTIDQTLQDKLHLSWTGKQTGSSGAGCTSTSRPARVKTWAVGGLWLDPQSVQVQSMPGFGGKDNAWGLLGSDVWSRFGAVRLDFLHQQLVVPGHEAKQPSQDRYVEGNGGPPTPRSLIHGHVTVSAPMMVQSGRDYTEMLVHVTLGSNSHVALAPDTGSSGSLIDDKTASRLGLATTKFVETGSTVCSTITTPYVLTGGWSLAGEAMPPLLVSTLSLGPLLQVGFSGLLGSDVFSRYPSVVFDYAGGRLLLGAG